MLSDFVSKADVKNGEEESGDAITKYGGTNLARVEATETVLDAVADVVLKSGAMSTPVSRFTRIVEDRHPA